MNAFGQLMSENSTLRTLLMAWTSDQVPLRVEIAAGTGALPVLLSVPHSGRDYSDALVGQARLGKASLERLEDPLVDLLVRGAIDRGIGAVIARAPRALIDCNRGEDDLDPRGVAGRSEAPVSERARSGLGLIPARLAGIGALWRGPIDEAGLEQRLAIHRGYHAALAEALAKLSAAWPQVVLIDCHSMPPRAAGQAQIVIGDRHGTSARSSVSAMAMGIASSMGFAVAHNAPFAGGHVVARHGRPEGGISAIQVEVDRGLYCGRDLRSPGHGFDRVAMLFERLASEIGGALAARETPQAAE